MAIRKTLLDAVCTRRQFMAFIATAAAAGAVFHPFRVMAAGAGVRNCLVVGAAKGGAMIDLASRKIVQIPLDFHPHSFMQHPNHPMKFIGIEKWGPNAAEVDFETRQVRALDKSDTWHYYGHGIYDEKKNAIFITRVNKSTGLGHLIGFDPDTYAVVEDYQVAAGGLHECHALPGRQVMFASSGIRAADYSMPQLGPRMESTALVIADIDTGKVVQALYAHDEDQIIGHFAVTKTGALLALAGPTPTGKAKAGHLYYSPGRDTPLKALVWPQDAAQAIKGEMLSVALNDDHTRAAVTNPAGKCVALVDMTKGEIIRVMEEDWNGVAFDAASQKFVGTHLGIETIDEDFRDVATFSLDTDESGLTLSGAHSGMFRV